MSKIYWNKRNTLNPLIAKMTLFLSNQKIIDRHLFNLHFR